MAKDINEQLNELKQEQEIENLPAEENVLAEDEQIQSGTEADITEEETISEENAADSKPKSVPKGSRRGSKALMLELEKTKQLAEDNADKYKRLLAEFENVRQRNEKESKKMYDFGAKDVLEKLLPVIDNFERAISCIPEEDKERAFEQGVDKIYKQMLETFIGVGVAPMNAEGKAFDPEIHNAVMHVEDEQFEDNVVVEELQKGYMFKDQVLRHSMVKVAN